MSSQGSNSEDGKTVDYFQDQLFRHVSGILASGSFATHGSYDSFVPPGLSIQSIGQVRLPLTQDDARSLVDASCQAPFGKGAETVVDKSVRNTWEISSEQIKFLNPAWQSCLDHVVGKAAFGLGIVGGAANVRAELYKMLLYETGAMFKEHQE